MEPIEPLLNQGVVLGVRTARILDQQCARELQHVVLTLTQKHCDHLRSQPVSVIVSRYQCLETLDSLCGTEEFLVFSYHVIDSATAEAEVLAHQCCPIGCEHPVGQLEVKQPVAGSRGHGGTSVNQELLLWLSPKHPILHRILVVLDPDGGHVANVERIEVGGILAVSIVPEDQALRLKLLLQTRQNSTE